MRYTAIFPDHSPIVGRLVVLSMLVLFTFIYQFITAYPDYSTTLSLPTKPVWLSKPVLGYFALVPSLTNDLRRGARLSQHDYDIVIQVAQQESKLISHLNEESMVIINDVMLSLSEKQNAIINMEYNARLDSIMRDSDSLLRVLLDQSKYRRLVSWIERRWRVEKIFHGKPKQAGLRSYEIFATHYDSGGVYTVALPDKCVKFANAGKVLSDCTGYSNKGGYDLIIRYKNSTGVTVGEAGPWNIDDGYWATRQDPTPRRMFTDLPTGMPEAQAAYFNGYNGGKDQYGRKVTGPYGIDLGKPVGKDIGLKWGVNDWITVSFMWTEGWGSGKKQAGTSAPGETQYGSVQLSTNTPLPDGSIIHIVQTGQALWNIAAIYGISLDELLLLNELTRDSFIHVGDKLVIRPPQATDTPSPTLTTPTRTPTNTRTITPVPSSTQIVAGLLQSTTSPTLEMDSPETEVRFDPVLSGILLMVVIGIILITAGTIIGKRK